MLRLLKPIVIYLYFCFALCLTYLGFCRIDPPVESNIYLCWFSLIFIFVTFVLMIKLNNISIISFSSIYYLLSALFIGSNFPLYLIFKDDMFSFWFVPDSGFFKVSTVLILLGFSAFFLGTTINLTLNKDKNKFQGKVKNKSLCRRTGYFIFLLGIFIVLTESLIGRGLSVMYNHGYAEFYTTQMGGNLLFQISFSWLLPWGFIFILSTARNLRDALKDLILIIPLVIISLLGGDRGLALQIMASAFFVLSVNGWLKTNFLSVFKAIIALLLLIVVFVGLGNVRSSGIKEWRMSDFIDQQEDEVTNNPLLLLMTETTITNQSIPGTLNLVPAKEDFRYGYDYLKMFINAIPFGGKLFGFDFSKKTDGIQPSPTAWFTYHYNKYNDVGYGYLQLMEAYLQFNTIGILFVFTFLGFVTKKSWNLIKYRKIFDCRIIAIIFLFNSALLLKIRNDSGGTIREIFYAFVLLFIIGPIFNALLRSLISLNFQQK